MFVEFCFAGKGRGKLDISQFAEVAARLKKGKLKSNDLPIISDTFDIIRSMIEEMAQKEGMTYEQYISLLRKKAKEAEDKQEQNDPQPRADEQPDEGPAGESSSEGNSNEKQPDSAATAGPDNSDDSASQNGNPSNPSEPEKTRDGRNKPEGGKPAGSGKTPISKLASKTTPLAVIGISQGDSCPACHAGTIHPIAPGVIGRIHVQATFTFEEVQVEKFRCNSCGQTIAASVPPEISEDHVRGASFSAAAALLVMRHHLAVPNLRIERLNDWLGTRLSDSRQWDIMREAAFLLLPLYEAMLQFAADAAVQVLDDGWCRIICIHRAIREEIRAAEICGIRKEDLRTGVNTTVILGYEGEHTVCVYISGRRHQGENAHILNGMRANDLPVIRMSDAATKATATHEFPDRDPRGFILSHGGKTIIDSRVQTVHCLTHLRNKFDELRDHAPELCAFIIDRISGIYAVDDEAAAAGLGPQARMLLHQAKSTLLVEDIQERVAAELASKNWLPKEPIAKALSYAKENGCIRRLMSLIFVK